MSATPCGCDLEAHWTCQRHLDEAQRADYEERAAILEFDAGWPRADAEALALKMIQRTVGE